MGDTVRSVFRRREVEKIYEINRYKYSVYYDDLLDVRMNMRENTDNIISDKEIGRYDIELPMLGVGDKFFLHNIQEEVVIKSRLRSSDGSIVYYVKDKLVETENTKRTREECDKVMREFKEVKEKFNKYASKYKYAHRFFNFISSKIKFK